MFEKKLEQMSKDLNEMREQQNLQNVLLQEHLSRQSHVSNSNENSQREFFTSGVRDRSSTFNGKRMANDKRLNQTKTQRMDMRLIKVQVTQEDTPYDPGTSEVRRFNSNQVQSNHMNIIDCSEKSPCMRNQPKEANDFKLFTQSVTKLEVNREEEKQPESSDQWGDQSGREPINYESLQD